MIILNLKKVKSSKSIIQEYENMLNITNIVCPNCDSDDYIYYGTYFRNVLYINNGIFTEDTIKIKRIKCKECGHTHAIIPSFLVPYKQFSLDTIIEVLTEKILNNNNYIVSRQLIKKWMNEYLKEKSKLEVMYEKYNSEELIKVIYCDLDNITLKYYNENRELFMLSRSMIIYNYAPT